MNLLSRVLPLSLVSVLFSGCASTDNPIAGDAQPTTTQREYRTGSRIPVKDPVPLTKEEKEQQAEEARAVLSKRSGGGGSSGTVSR